MVNESWLENMPKKTNTHLSSTGYDHCPLLLKIVSKETNHIKYFKFLNFWADNPFFMENVLTCWDREVIVMGMWRFHQELKRLSNTLSAWSRKEFGDILQNARMYEE